MNEESESNEGRIKEKDKIKMFAASKKNICQRHRKGFMHSFAHGKVRCVVLKIKVYATAKHRINLS